jgi:hypothetical protein
MGFFWSFFGCNKRADDTTSGAETPSASAFMSDAVYQQNRTRQIAMTPQTMEQLRDYGVTDDKHLKLEYFFYTNRKQKAESLAKELANRGYDGNYDVAAGIPSQFVITGWTTPMQMTSAGVVGWVGEMCDLGCRFDAEFDGWGTNPNQ